MLREKDVFSTRGRVEVPEGRRSIFPFSIGRTARLAVDSSNTYDRQHQVDAEPAQAKLDD